MFTHAFVDSMLLYQIQNFCVESNQFLASLSIFKVNDLVENRLFNIILTQIPEKICDVPMQSVTSSQSRMNEELFDLEEKY
jgi:hypothetical protein